MTDPNPAEYDGECVIYVRLSSDREGNEVGVVRQEAECRELASRINLKVVAVYPDNDRGASNLSKKSSGYCALPEPVFRG